MFEAFNFPFHGVLLDPFIEHSCSTFDETSPFLASPFSIIFSGGVATPLWPSVGVKPNTSKVGDLESSGTPECLEFDRKAQNTSH
jgi:hypothetical protein